MSYFIKQLYLAMTGATKPCQSNEAEKTFLKQLYLPILHYLADLTDTSTDAYLWKLKVLCNSENFQWFVTRKITCAAMVACRSSLHLASHSASDTR